MEKGSGSGLSKQKPRSKPASSVDFTGGRLRFRVELNPDETTIVSWKNLVKQATLANSVPNSSLSPSLGAQHSFDTNPSRPPPPPSMEPSFANQMMENDPKDLQAEAGSNRLSTVIEKIERFYVGDLSSDEENPALDNVRNDEDEYDTEDSFIDDAELDNYFEVEHSTIKYDGYFVHRGKLEHNEPIISTDQQPKKRGHTDLNEGSGSDDGHNPHKVVKKGSECETVSSDQRSSASLPDKEDTLNVQMKSGDPMPTVGNEGLGIGDVEKTDAEYASVPSS
ncbi:hypothetical protein ACS0TY_032218 [Phlomoides rotata]